MNDSISNLGRSCRRLNKSLLLPTSTKKEYIYILINMLKEIYYKSNNNNNNNNNKTLSGFPRFAQYLYKNIPNCVC